MDAKWPLLSHSMQKNNIGPYEEVVQEAGDFYWFKPCLPLKISALRPTMEETLAKAEPVSKVTNF